MVMPSRKVTRERHGHVVSAVVLYVLLAYLAPSWAGALRADTSYAAMIAWVRCPAHAAALVLLLGVGFHHFAYGLRVMIEDYISDLVGQRIAVRAINGACFISALAGVLAVLKIGFGA